MYNLNLKLPFSFLSTSFWEDLAKKKIFWTLSREHLMMEREYPAVRLGCNQTRLSLEFSSFCCWWWWWPVVRVQLDKETSHGRLGTRTKGRQTNMAGYVCRGRRRRSPRLILLSRYNNRSSIEWLTPCCVPRDHKIVNTYHTHTQRAQLPRHT